MNIFSKILLLAVILFFVWLLTRNIFEVQKNYRFYNSLQQEYEDTKQQHTKLKTGLLIASDSAELEKTIRNRLNLAKDGEYVVILPSPTPAQIIPTPTMAPIYQQWWSRYFRN